MFRAAHSVPESSREPFVGDHPLVARTGWATLALLPRTLTSSIVNPKVPGGGEREAGRDKESLPSDEVVAHDIPEMVSDLASDTGTP